MSQTTSKLKITGVEQLPFEVVQQTLVPKVGEEMFAPVGGMMVKGLPFWCLNEELPVFFEALQELSFHQPKTMITAMSWVIKQVPTKHISPLTINRFRKGVQTTQKFHNPKNPPAEYLADKAKAEAKDQYGTIGVDSVKSGPMGDSFTASQSQRLVPDPVDLATLGIHDPESATWPTIKQAFKTLALRNHPDMNKGSKQSEQRFKKVRQAYDNLSRIYAESLMEKEVIAVLTEILPKG